jgi:hypothetical protein
MISMPPSVVAAISADASLRASSRPRKRNWLAALCAVLAALLCGMASTAPAQTAHLNSSEGTQTTLGSGFNEPTGVAVASGAVSLSVGPSLESDPITSLNEPRI